MADDATQLVWESVPALYSDKSVVEWVGADGSDHPASVTTVVAGTGEGDYRAPAAGDAGSAASDEADNGSNDTKENVTLGLSIAAVALGALALIAALARKNASAGK